ncbi:hypothetical protein U14_00161 [Candidatus Moduliflexus flocculans]|uniref:Uncharacterized protein n=1 Tax=Candidatus Moduliflexus flocculans TaxID=1499966 RepID=A0A0S6VPH9_9BACT|nr:hypothetical protein U14_00161 [Candidatus Moduliflexus flocculans]
MRLRAFSAGNVGERGRSRYVVLNNYHFLTLLNSCYAADSRRMTAHSPPGRGWGWVLDTSNHSRTNPPLAPPRRGIVGGAA